MTRPNRSTARRGTFARHHRGPRPGLRDPADRRRRPLPAALRDRRRRRHPGPLRHPGGRRGHRRREEPQGDRPRRRRPRQRRHQGRHPGRCHGGQRPDLEHHLRRRTDGRPHPLPRPPHPAGQLSAQGRRVEALQVHRHRTVREEDRHHRPRPDRRARRRPPQGLRHQDPRLRPLHHLGPRRPARRAAGDLRRAARAVRLHHHPHAQDAGDRRHARRRSLQEDEEHRVRRQRRPRRPRRRGSPLRRAQDGEIAGAGVDVFVKEPSTDLPFFKLDNVVVTPHLGASTDEAQEKAGVSVANPSAWPWPANLFRMPSTSPAA